MSKSNETMSTLGVLLLAGAAIVAAAIFLPEAKPEDSPEITDGKKKRFYKMSVKELKDELKSYVAVEDWKACIFLRDLIQEKTGIKQIKD